MTEPLKLKVPVRVTESDPLVTELTFKDFTVRELRTVKLKPTTFEDLFVIAELLTGQPAALLNRLDPADAGAVLARVNEALTPFAVGAATTPAS